MASKQDIKKVILEIAGYPESGPVVALADKWAEAIVGLDSPAVVTASSGPAQETRVIKPEATR
jgi:hypothetical protein